MEKQPIKNLKRILLALFLGWTFIFTALFLWNINEIKRETEETAYIQAVVAINKDMLYRRWNSNHGGVYAEVTEKTPPNPYLSHVPDRDITANTGKLLTLINPAYMTRQVNEFEAEISEVRSHITSLNPINPKNAPDSWEQIALEAFETGTKKASIMTFFDEQPYYRLMRPFITEKACLKCHAEQGYKENDIRGGISISIPMKSLLIVEEGIKKRAMLIYGFIWLLGIGGLAMSYFKLKNSFLKQNDAEMALEKAYLEVEQKVVDRTKELNNEILERKNAEEQIIEQLNELKRWQIVMIDRETRNIELKHEVNELLKETGKQEKYKSCKDQRLEKNRHADETDASNADKNG